MIKSLSLLTRKPHLSHDEFVRGHDEDTLPACRLGRPIRRKPVTPGRFSVEPRGAVSYPDTTGACAPTRHRGDIDETGALTRGGIC